VALAVEECLDVLELTAPVLQPHRCLGGVRARHVLRTESPKEAQERIHQTFHGRGAVALG
jgi:hypothetical protein